MRINKSKIFGLFTAIVMTTVVSCDDEVTLQNLNATSVDTFFSNKSEIGASSASMYTHLQTQGLYQRYGYIVPDLMSDEMTPSGDPNFKPPYDFALSATNGIVGAYWQQAFNGVGKANFVIGNEDVMRANLAADGADFTEADINQAVGEGHFMRGLYYYLLVKRFGGVPMPIGYPVTDALPRSTEDEVYAQIIADFKRASELLKDKSQLSGQEARASKGAALGMLGKVNLHRNNLPEAKTALDAISGYSLLSAANYTDNFNVSGEFNNQESMFEVNFTNDNTNSWAGNGEGVNEITFHAQEYTAWGNARPSQKMLDEFEVDDPRKDLVTITQGDSYGPGNAFTWNNDGTRWRKYSDLYELQNIIPESNTNTRFLRYADVLLLQAEVANKMGNDGTSAGGALFYLNQLRTRFGLPLYGSATMDARGYPVNTPANVLKAIVHERMVELCGEQHRFDDLVRWGLDATELQLDNSGGQRGYNPSIHKFLPIPQSEIDTNANISAEDQNPGY